MVRLPVPGGDDGSWGDILNTFLKKSHDTDGTLKLSAITEAGGGTYTKPADGIPGSDISAGAIDSSHLTGSLQTTLSGVVTFADSGTWAAATVYSAGSIVTYSGGRYIAPAGASASNFFDTTKWILLGAAPDSF